MKKFQGMEMPEILEKVRQELGPDAVILSTRKLKKGSGAFGMLSREILEVTAAADLEEVADRFEPSAPAPQSKGLPPEYQKVLETARRAAGVSGPAQDSGADARARQLFHSLQSEIDSLREELSTLGRAGFRAPEPLTLNLKAIEEKLDQLVERSTPMNLVSLSPGLKRLHALLETRDLDPGLSAKIFSYLQSKLDKGELRAGEEERALRELIARTVTVAEPPSGGRRRRVWAFVGPTGVGKTTTVAKLAASFALKDSLRVGLITVDTFRIAAVEQLKTYAGIMDVPLRVALDAEAFARAVREFSDRDLILVDTAGQSPRDEEALGALLDLFPPDVETEVHLVLSVTTRSKDLERILRHYAPANARRLVLTKLDETDCLGPLLTLPVVSRLPLAYLTMGQNVPDDIEAATADAVAAYLLGRPEDDA